MERKSSTAAASEKQFKYSKTEHEEEEEEENDDFSLSDFPLNQTIKEGNKQPKFYERNASQVNEAQDKEFVFGSTESQMCAADELFFQGQILPLRLSVTSEHGLFKPDSQNANRFLSRSESMNHIGSMGRGFRSNSYSSRGTQRSSSNSSNGSSSTIAITRVASESRVPRNHFHSSPKPQIRTSSARIERVSSRNQTSTFWGFFTLGVARTPAMNLQELKVIHSLNNIHIDKKASNISRNSNLKSNNRVKDTILKEEKQSKIKFFSGCKCSVNQIVGNSNAIIIKNRSKRSTSTNECVNDKDDGHDQSSAKHDENVVIELKMKKMQKPKQHGKQAMSHHRTYEWLKELSHANFPSYVSKEG